MSLIQLKGRFNHDISILWVLFYLPAHQFIAQTFQYPNSFLFLRLILLGVIVLTLMFSNRMSSVHTIFIGRWLQGRKDWIAAAVCLLSVLLVQEIISHVINFRKEDLSDYFSNAITAPIDEEIVFRGVFLAAVLPYFSRWPFGAVLLTSAMFVGCHDLTYSVWQVWLALTTQSLIYGFCYIWTGCVPLCILCHWLWNTLFFI
jgi:membrane protease YdiL (CAAX protease family)